MKFQSETLLKGYPTRDWRRSSVGRYLTKGSFLILFMSLNLRIIRRTKGDISTDLHKIRVEDITEEGLEVHFSDPKEEWNRYLQETPSIDFIIKGPVVVEARLRLTGKAVQVQAEVHTTLSLRCCRCLEDFPYSLTSPIVVTLFPGTHVAKEGEIELEREDLETAYFSGDEIDLSGLIREQIFLTIPYKPLCHEDCKGLCSRCGANLNIVDCGCEKNVRDSAFGILKNLKLDGE